MLDQSSKTQLSSGWTNPLLGCKPFQLCCSSSPKNSFYTQQGWLWLSFSSSHCLWHFCACQAPALPRFLFLCQLPGRCIQEKSSSPSGILQPCSSWLFLPAQRDKVQLLGQPPAAGTATSLVWEPLFTLQLSPTNPSWPWAAGSSCGRVYKWWDKCCRGLKAVKAPRVTVACQGEPWLSSVCGAQPKERGLRWRRRGTKHPCHVLMMPETGQCHCHLSLVCCLSSSVTFLLALSSINHCTDLLSGKHLDFLNQR